MKGGRPVDDCGGAGGINLDKGEEPAAWIRLLELPGP